MNLHPDAPLPEVREDHPSGVPHLPDAIEITRLLSDMGDPRRITGDVDDAIETLRSLILMAKKAYGEPETFDRGQPDDCPDCEDAFTCSRCEEDCACPVPASCPDHVACSQCGETGVEEDLNTAYPLCFGCARAERSRT